MSGRLAIPLLVGGFAGCGPRAGGAAPLGAEHPLAGAAAPDFSLAAQSGGKSAALKDARGKVGIVDFWATWCEPCRDSFPFYQSLVQEHGGDVVMLGISEDDAPDGIAKFGEETGAKFVLAWDEGKAVASSYSPGGMPTMPTSFFVDRNGIVSYVHEGFRAGDDEVVRAKVSEIAAK